MVNAYEKENSLKFLNVAHWQIKSVCVATAVLFRASCIYVCNVCGRSNAMYGSDVRNRVDRSGVCNRRVNQEFVTNESDQRCSADESDQRYEQMSQIRGMNR